MKTKLAREEKPDPQSPEAIRVAALVVEIEARVARINVIRAEGAARLAQEKAGRRRRSA